MLTAPVPKILLEVLILPTINFIAYMTSHKAIWNTPIDPAEIFVDKNTSVIKTYALGRLILLGCTAIKCKLVGLNMMYIIYAGQMSMSIKQHATKSN